MKPLNMSRVLGTIISVLIFTFATMAAAGQMDASTISWNIPAQSLKSALETYQQVSGLNLAYSDNLVEGKTTRGVQGNHTREQALEKVLNGAGLTHVVTAKGTVILKVKNPGAAPHKTVAAAENKTEESTIQQARKEMQLEEVTVSAQKTEENVQDVPISISVFDELTIQDRMIETVQDIAKYTPGLEIINLGCAVKSAPAIRGLYSGYESKSSTAGLYIDGIPVTDGTGFDETLMDIERIEVLKGPQGTLYGKNTEVGVVNIITKKPDNETKGKVLVTTGSDSKKELAFSVSGPIVKDRFYIGVSGKHYEKDGFIYNTSKDKIEDDREHNYGKINFRWTPTDNLEASLIYSKIKYNNGANASGLATDKDRVVSSDLNTFNKNEVELSALNISYTINDRLSLTSTTAQRKYYEYTANDFDYTDENAKKFHVSNDSTYDTFSEELKLNYENKNIKIISGIFLENSDIDMNKERDTYWGFGEALQDTDSDSLGLFSHITYSITERLSVLGGLRYDIVEQTYKDPNETIDNDESEISPKIGLTYDLKDNLMTYATISKGYRAGGFNVGAPEGYSKTVDKESLYSYEVGFKGSAIDNRLTYSTSLYYMEISDMQVLFKPDPANAVTLNAAEATSWGIESSLQFQATDSLNLFAGISYNDAYFDEYNDGVTDLSGKKTTYTPEYSFNIGVLYRTMNGFYASADLSGYGDMYLDRNNEYKRDAFVLVNTKIGYETNSYDIYLYATNLFDEEYDMDDGNYLTYSQPREIGVQLTYRF